MRWSRSSLFYNIRVVENAILWFLKIWFFPTYIDFCKISYKKLSCFMTDFHRSNKVLPFDKIFPCGNFWQHNGGLFSIFRILHGSWLPLLAIIYTAIYHSSNIEMDHSTLRAILKRKGLSPLLTSFMSNIGGNI